MRGAQAHAPWGAAALPEAGGKGGSGFPQAALGGKSRPLSRSPGGQGRAERSGGGRGGVARIAALQPQQTLVSWTSGFPSPQQRVEPCPGSPPARERRQLSLSRSTQSFASQISPTGAGAVLRSQSPYRSRPTPRAGFNNPLPKQSHAPAFCTVDVTFRLF